MKVGVRAHDFGSTIPMNLKAMKEKLNAQIEQLAEAKINDTMNSCKNWY